MLRLWPTRDQAYYGARPDQTPWIRGGSPTGAYSRGVNSRLGPGDSRKTSSTWSWHHISTHRSTLRPMALNPAPGYKGSAATAPDRANDHEREEGLDDGKQHVAVRS